jgi:hypothetical protein
MSEYKIRELTRQDRVILTSIFKRVIKTLNREDLMSIFKSVDTDEILKSKDMETDNIPNEEEVGAKIISIALEIISDSMDILDSDVGEWFSSLLGVSVEDFDKLPISIELDILDQLGAAPEAVDFFGRCWERAKKISWLESLSKIGKQKLNIK